ncbi:hypothetical protein AMTRI_Chr03g147770 [Amborella trichopoda]
MTHTYTMLPTSPTIHHPNLPPPPPELTPKWHAKAASMSVHPCLTMLQTCPNMRTLKQIHAHMLRLHLVSDTFCVSRLVAFCALSPKGSLDYARLLFSQLPFSLINSFITNTMIRGLSNSSNPHLALEFYRNLQAEGLETDHHAPTFLLKACSRMGSATLGHAIHGRAVKTGLESDLYIGNALVHAYASFGEVDDANKVFDEMPMRDMVSWNALINGYVENAQFREAFQQFSKMGLENFQADEVTMVGLLSACGQMGALTIGRALHAHVIRQDLKIGVVLNTALIDMYAKCGQLRLSRKLFDSMPQKTVVTWNTIMAGYAQGRESKETLSLFESLLGSNEVWPNAITMLSVLSACANLGALKQGQWVHKYIERYGVVMDEFVMTALIDMYAKCGSIENARSVFKRAERRDVSVWTAMIQGLATHGQGREALDLFEEMQREGVKPNAVTFVGVLCACTHSGLVNEARYLFKAMAQDYGIKPKVEHYACMVDLLGRVGRLDEARALIESMPVEPDEFVWGALLGGCRIHGNIALAEEAMAQLVTLNPHNGGVYVLGSNMYSEVGQWDLAAKLRKKMREIGVKKPPGCTIIEMGGLVHEFVAGDYVHKNAKEIHEMLGEIRNRLDELGYIPNTSVVVLDLDEEEKERALGVHSEKLAIAFGLINTVKGEVIRMVKNLRVCEDCHEFSKAVSRAFGREIVVRDRTRFHHFKDGSCSCKDFW